MAWVAVRPPSSAPPTSASPASHPDSTRVNSTFSEEDRVMLDTLSKRLREHKALIGAIENNASEDAVRVKFDEIFTKELVSMFRSNFDLFRKIEENTELKDYVNTKMYEFIHQQVRNSKASTLGK